MPTSRPTHGNHASVEPNRSQPPTGRHTLGEPTRRRQAIHEPSRPTTYRTLRPLSHTNRPYTYKSAIHSALQLSHCVMCITSSVPRCPDCVESETPPQLRWCDLTSDAITSLNLLSWNCSRLREWHELETRACHRPRRVSLVVLQQAVTWPEEAPADSAARVFDILLRGLGEGETSWSTTPSCTPAVDEIQAGLCSFI